MKCGAVLSEETIDETTRLQMELAKLKETNDLLMKSLKEAQTADNSQSATQLQEQINEMSNTMSLLEEKISNQTKTGKPSPPPNSPKDNKKTIGVIIVLASIALTVFGIFYYSNIYLPAKIDREAARYYTFADKTNLRSSQEVGVDYNRIASLNYGSELITYSYGQEWSEVKDAAGNKGWISSEFLLDKSDFSTLNSIFGDNESKQCINTAKCRLALLNYFKTNSLGNEWQVLCRPKEVKPNAVFYPRLYNKNSKFTDFAVIIKNTLTSERKIVIFGFNDDESVSWTKSGDAPYEGYIKNITLNSLGEIYVDYTN
jgi:hypothetical protein